MSVSVRQILDLVEQQGPATLAYAWDRVGLLIGSPGQEVTRLVVALEASEEVLQGAVAVGAQMVLSHHPLLFQPVERFCPDKPLDRAIGFAIKHDLAVAAAHTNLDAAADGAGGLRPGLSGSEPQNARRAWPLGRASRALSIWRCREADVSG